MTPYIRHCLSRQAIDKLLGRDKNSFFSVFSRVASKQTEPDLQACEDAIAPLLNFLEHNLSMLNENLTETIMQFVVLKIWKQILRTLDNILLPPLSEHLSEINPLDDYQLHVVLKWLEVSTFLLYHLMQVLKNHIFSYLKFCLTVAKMEMQFHLKA